MATPTRMFLVMPHTTPATFKRMFEIADRRWPGIKLGYVGTSQSGDHYLQEVGNPEPFIIRAKELPINE